MDFFFAELKNRHLVNDFDNVMPFALYMYVSDGSGHHGGDLGRWHSNDVCSAEDPHQRFSAQKRSSVEGDFFIHDHDFAQRDL